MRADLIRQVFGTVVAKRSDPSCLASGPGLRSVRTRPAHVLHGNTLTAFDRFESKALARAYFKELLNSSELRASIGEPGATDLARLLMHHPDAAGKIGPGIKSFFVDVETFGRSRCFWLTRTDGTTVHWSYLVVINEKRPAPHTCVSLACRVACAPDILAAKSTKFARGEVRSPISGVILDPATCHVDHVDPTFDEIVNAWMAARKYTPDDVPFGSKSVTGWMLSDEAGADFRAFHRASNPKIQFLTATENLSKGGR